MLVHGVYAAVLVPRGPDGELDESGFRGILNFLLAKGMARLVVNGATGEYCATTPTDLARMLAICGETLAGRGEFLCGIGGATLPECRELGRIAIKAGARALLLPMPHFFPYSQEDLQAFCTAVAGELAAPILLYNLPRFTTPLELETVRALLASVPNMIGIKDSSGSLETLRALAGSRACRIVGDDSVLVSAASEGACDGVISGVAGVAPELIATLFHQPRSVRHAALLDDLIGWLREFPVPWGLKVVAECRGMAPATFLEPVSSHRAERMCAFKQWLPGWLAAMESALS